MKPVLSTVPLSESGFPDQCQRPMTHTEYAEHDGWVAFFDSRPETAFMAYVSTHAPREGPREPLAGILERASPECGDRRSYALRRPRLIPLHLALHELGEL